MNNKINIFLTAVFLMVLIYKFNSIEPVIKTDKNIDTNKSTAVDFNIHLNKDTFAEGEYIWLWLEAIVKDRKLKYKPELFPNSDVTLYLFNSKGLVNYWGGFPDFWRIRDYQDTIFNIKNLLDGYGNIEMNFLSTLPADKYTLYADLKVELKDKEEIIRSNTIQFNIRKKTAQEDNQYKVFYEIMSEKFNKSKIDNDMINKSLSSLTSNPNSIFRDNYIHFNFKYGSYFYSLNPLQKKEYLIKLLNENKNDYFNYAVINRFRTVKDEAPELIQQSLKQYLESIKPEFKNTLTEKFINKVIIDEQLWENEKKRGLR